MLVHKNRKERKTREIGKNPAQLGSKPNPRTPLPSARSISFPGRPSLPLLPSSRSAQSGPSPRQRLSQPAPSLPHAQPSTRSRRPAPLAPCAPDPTCRLRLPRRAAQQRTPVISGRDPRRAPRPNPARDPWFPLLKPSRTPLRRHPTPQRSPNLSLAPPRRRIHAGEPLFRLNSSPPVTTGLIRLWTTLAGPARTPSGRPSAWSTPLPAPPPSSAPTRRLATADDLPARSPRPNPSLGKRL